MNMNTSPTPHPTSHNAVQDRLHERENLARQLRTTQMMREQAREQINATDIIQRILDTQLKLMGEEDVAGNPIPIDPAYTKQLVAISNIDFKLLSKVLPDLKATESVSYSAHDHNHNHQHKAVDDLELIARLRLFKKNNQPQIIEHDNNATHEEEQTALRGALAQETLDSIPTAAEFDFL